MAWASIRVAPWWRTAVSTSFSDGSGRASAFVVASFMVAYSSASWACGWSCNNPGYAALLTLSSTTFDHSSVHGGVLQCLVGMWVVLQQPRVRRLTHAFIHNFRS